MNENNLKRNLGLFSITMLGIGATIGAGVFVLTGYAIGEAGPAVILAFALNGILALVVSVNYMELSTAMPKAGGSFFWVSEIIGEKTGFFTGWIGWFARISAASLYAVGFGSFTENFLHSMNIIKIENLSIIISILAVLAFILINIRGSSETGKAESIITSIKILILIVFVGFGIVFIQGSPESASHYEPFLPQGMIGVFLAMGLTFVAFEGFEVITNTAEEARNPRKNIPRAIFLTLIVSTILYVVIAFVMIGAIEIPYNENASSFFSKLGEFGITATAQNIMPDGELILLIAGMASTASALNAIMFSSGRIIFAMARKKLFFPGLAKIHPKFKTPYLGIAASGIIIIIFLNIMPLKEIAASTSMMFLILFSIVCFALIKFRKTNSKYNPSFRVPFVPVLPIIGIISGIGLAILMYNVSLNAWLIVLAWFTIGALFLVLIKKGLFDK